MIFPWVLQNVQDYKGIIELSNTSSKTKQLGAQLIPRYFKFFTGLATEAFDAFLDIIEEVDIAVTSLVLIFTLSCIVRLLLISMFCCDA